MLKWKEAVSHSLRQTIDCKIRSVVLFVLETRQVGIEREVVTKRHLYLFQIEDELRDGVH